MGGAAPLGAEMPGAPRLPEALPPTCLSPAACSRVLVAVRGSFSLALSGWLRREAGGWGLGRGGGAGAQGGQAPQLSSRTLFPSGKKRWVDAAFLQVKALCTAAWAWPWGWGPRQLGLPHGCAPFGREALTSRADVPWGWEDGRPGPPQPRPGWGQAGPWGWG